MSLGTGFGTEKTQVIASLLSLLLVCISRCGLSASGHREGHPLTRCLHDHGLQLSGTANLDEPFLP